MDDREIEEEERLLNLLLEAAERPRKSFREGMEELFTAMAKWESIRSHPIYAYSGVCYLCGDSVPKPEEGKALTLSDIVCDGCKKEGFWK